MLGKAIDDNNNKMRIVEWPGVVVGKIVYERTHVNVMIRGKVKDANTFARAHTNTHTYRITEVEYEFGQVQPCMKEVYPMN